MKLSGPDKAKLEQRESQYGVPENGKTWLKVPFSEKDQAKQPGAKWDQTQKMWFAPEGEDVQKFAAWLPENKAAAQQKEKPQEPRLATEKTYLNVPYREKGQAKKLGARWDKSEKLWFAPTGTDLTPLANWLPKEKVNAPQTNAVQIFAKALQEAGLDLQGQQPIMDGTLQRVPVIDGKPFEKGGLKAGMFHTIDPGESIAKGGPILVAEGYATAASAHMASNMPTVVAFDASNLEPVAKALKAKYPKSSIVLVSDNDHHLEKNVGIEKAEAAAKAVGGLMATPKFNEAEKEQGLSDFNDLHKSRGIGEVQKQMSQTIKMAKSMKAGALPLAMAM